MNVSGKKEQTIRRSCVSAHHFALTIRRPGFLAAPHSFRCAGSGAWCLQLFLASCPCLWNADYNCWWSWGYSSLPSFPAPCVFFHISFSPQCPQAPPPSRSSLPLHREQGVPPPRRETLTTLETVQACAYFFYRFFYLKGCSSVDCLILRTFVYFMCPRTISLHHTNSLLPNSAAVCSYANASVSCPDNY